MPAGKSTRIALPHQRTQQRLARRDATLRTGNQSHQTCFSSNKQEHKGGIGTAALLLLTHRSNHTIDDQLADPGHGGGQHPGHQR